MGGRNVRMRLGPLAVVLAATMLVGPVAAQPPPPAPELDDPEPAADQRSTRADVPDLPPARPLPPPPSGLDMRRPRLGPGGIHLPNDAPDPHMLVVDGTHYLFSTNTSVARVPVWTSTDLSSWELVGDAMPRLPRWADKEGETTWAPSVHRVGSTFNLYFSGLHRNRRRFCIGVATAEQASGPYQPRGKPLVCQTHRGGSIDPFLFTDVTDGRSASYLVYKTDGNCCGLTTKLWTQRLTVDGLRLSGRPSELLFAGAEWEEGVIEGPTMVQRAGRYHLLYSGNWWNTHFYSVGHAVCESVRGPCHRSSEKPFMTNRSDGVGFGGPSVWSSPLGEVWMSYHGWYGPGVGYENGGVRAAFAHRLDFPDWSPPPRCFGVAATIVGTNRSDVITGTDGPDVIVARGGADTIDGRGGDDLICAGRGNDNIRGGVGSDRIRGEGGRDTVNSDGGKDFVHGGPGNDILRGGLGEDRVWGAGNFDQCWGERMRCEVENRTPHGGPKASRPN